MEFIAGAIVGAVLVFGGYWYGKSRTPAPVERNDDEEEDSRGKLEITVYDSRRERRKKLDAQLINIMTYNGKAQK